MASATLKATLSVSSTDLMDSVNLSKTVSANLTVDGDNRQGLATVKTSTAYQDLTVEVLSGTTGGGKKAYVYVKNTDTVDDLILADDNSTPQIFSRLAPGEFCFYPTADNTTVKVKASANNPICEYMILEVD
tara:strand:+ start:179 stop:574 length:396 start_codon:yes stop_codon:yes gene_type:complete